jgi:hypothetical protein
MGKKAENSNFLEMGLSARAHNIPQEPFKRMGSSSALLSLSASSIAAICTRMRHRADIQVEWTRAHTCHLHAETQYLSINTILLCYFQRRTLGEHSRPCFHWFLGFLEWFSPKTPIFCKFLWFLMDSCSFCMLSLVMVG